MSVYTHTHLYKISNMIIYKLRIRQDKILLDAEYDSREEAEVSAAHNVSNHPDLDWHDVYEVVESQRASQAEPAEAAVRAWAERKGYNVRARGRLKQAIIDEYIKDKKKHTTG
jgi:hypothetical protein